MACCIILSAGLSERFGSPKALARLDSMTVMEHILKQAMASSCPEIIVVLGAYATEIEPYVFNHKRIRIVHNKDYKFGQTSSVQAGVRAILPSNEPFLLWPVDCPLIQSSTVDQVINKSRDKADAILIPTFQGKRGHPPLFPHRLKQDILNLDLSMGLNSLFAAYPPQSIEINDPGITKTFNTPGEFEQIQKNGDT